MYSLFNKYMKTRYIIYFKIIQLRIDEVKQYWSEDQSFFRKAVAHSFQQALIDSLLFFISQVRKQGIQRWVSHSHFHKSVRPVKESDSNNVSALQWIGYFTWMGAQRMSVAAWVNRKLRKAFLSVILKSVLKDKQNFLHRYSRCKPV